MYQPSPDGDREPVPAMLLPWTIPPSDEGHAVCDWCGRAIYVPAVPCSVRPVPGLMAIDTGPLGDRCKWELSTRNAASEVRADI